MESDEVALEDGGLVAGDAVERVSALRGPPSTTATRRRPGGAGNRPPGGVARAIRTLRAADKTGSSSYGLKGWPMRCHCSSNASTAYCLSGSQYARFPPRLRTAKARTSWGSKMYARGSVPSEFTMK